MEPWDFTHLSKRNECYGRLGVEVANGASFVALDLSPNTVLSAREALYLHVHRSSRRCYVGITIMEAGKRWNNGHGYRLHKHFGAAIKAHGWDEFEHYILAFIDSREAMNRAEVEAISAAGGHKTQFTYNLSPGGDTVAENDKPIVGVCLGTGETQAFNSGAEASRQLGLKNPDLPMRCARGEMRSAGGWWFKFEGSLDKPPGLWGEDFRQARLREARAREVVAVDLKTGEEKHFPTTYKAAQAFDLSQSTVYAIANGEGRSAKGWWFRFRENDEQPPTSWGRTSGAEKRRRTVYAVNLETGKRQTFRSTAEATRKLGLYQSAVTSVTTGKQASAGGWWFSYEADASPPRLYGGKLVSELRSKPIIAQDVQTGEQQRFKSAKAASIKLGIHRSAISQVLRGKRTSAGGFTFKLGD